MTSVRLEKAFELADRCWESAYGVEPVFVLKYLELAEQLLTQHNIVTGDAFRAHCTSKGLKRPTNLHPNVWVSGVRVLNKLGWTTPIKKVEPTEMHNHMNTVTLWQSELFRGGKNA